MTLIFPERTPLDMLNILHTYLGASRHTENILGVGKDSAFLLAFSLRVEESVRFCPFYEVLFKKR